MSYELNAQYVSKQLRQKNVHNLRDMKADSARRISCCPSFIEYAFITSEVSLNVPLSVTLVVLVSVTCSL